MVRTLSWERVLSGVPQGSDLGPILFLIYINDLPDYIQSICKIFADDTALFSKCKDFKKSERELNEDLAIIKEWTCQWKMDFDPDPKKQATEVCFSHKILINNPKLLSFNGSQVKISERHNHLGVILDTKLFSNTFFPYSINEFKKLNENLRNENHIYEFKNYLIKFMKVKENSAFSISDLLGLKLLTSLGLNFSHINEHKFMHNFRNTGTPMCYAVMDLKQRSITPPLPKFFSSPIEFRQ